MYVLRQAYMPSFWHGPKIQALRFDIYKSFFALISQIVLLLSCCLKFVIMDSVWDILKDQQLS